jgi:hypothetical protein
MDARKATMLAAVCGAVILVGVLMPWYSVSVRVAGLGGERVAVGGMAATVNGTEGDYHGGFVIVLGLLAGLAAAFLWRGAPKGLPVTPRGLGIVALGGHALATLVTLTDVFRTPERVSGMTIPGVDVSSGRGIGMFVTLIAAAAGTYLSYLALRGAPASPAAPTPPAS